MREEYGFSKGVRGVHAPRCAAGVDAEVDGAPAVAVVTLGPDLAHAFPNSQSANEALRLLIKAARKVQELPKAS